jgi:translation elongation factor EF-G
MFFSALVPVANLWGYQHAVMKMTEGKGTWSSQFSHYAIVPTIPPGRDPLASLVRA